jgi:hypothetical protein
MSHTALIRFAPQTCIERYNDPRWQRPRTVYDPGSLKMPPGRTSVPLIVNHDDDRVVGSVRAFSRMEDVGDPWTVAHATIDRCPSWLRKDDTKASFGYKVLFENPDVFGCEVVRDAFVTEVSLLSPDRKPKEPLARVVGLWEAENLPSPATRRSRRDKLAEQDAELRRGLEVGGYENSERILQAYQYELGLVSPFSLMTAR